MTVTFADKNEWLRRNIAICMINRCNTGFGVSRKSGFNQLFGKRRLKLVEPFSGNNLTGKKQICPNAVSSRYYSGLCSLSPKKSAFSVHECANPKFNLHLWLSFLAVYSLLFLFLTQLVGHLFEFISVGKFLKILKSLKRENR